jgi:2-hydroxychromene-2-carboxylate isomerase
VTLHEIKLYFAYTSPYSYLAMQPAYDLELSHRVRVRFVPFGVNIREVYGPLDRQDADRRKVQLDAMGLRR